MFAENQTATHQKSFKEKRFKYLKKDSDAILGVASLSYTLCEWILLTIVNQSNGIFT